MYEFVGGIPGAALGFIAGDVPGATAGYKVGSAAVRRYNSEQRVIFFTNYEETYSKRKIISSRSS